MSFSEFADFSAAPLDWNPPTVGSNLAAKRFLNGLPARRMPGEHHLQRARSRLYRDEILQENMRWKALAEIYTMHSFALL